MQILLKRDVYSEKAQTLRHHFHMDPAHYSLFLLLPCILFLVLISANAESYAAGPGSIGGGGTWGVATDQKRVYTNIANGFKKNFTTAGGWVAMDALTGKILWLMADPRNGTASGPVTVANGVVFGGSTTGTGPIYAMTASSGEILWSYETGATVYGGMSVSNGCAYLGNGLKIGVGAFNPSFTAGTSLYAFCVS